VGTSYELHAPADLTPERNPLYSLDGSRVVAVMKGKLSSPYRE
jgi:hypothetical protein